MKFKICLLTLILIAATVFSLSACSEDIFATSTVELTKMPENAIYEVGEFRFDDYAFTVTASNGTQEIIPVTEEFVSEYDLMLLNQVGTHEITLEYRGCTEKITVQITSKSMSKDGAVIPYLEPMTVVYDGQPHTMQIKGDIPSGANIRYESGPTFTQAGEYTVTVVITAENYEPLTLSEKMIIQKATYDLSGVIFEPDYGVDEDGKAKKAFIYDGESHCVQVSGTYPEELSIRYEIGTDKGDYSTYTEGNSAVNAGMYFVRAIFSGDTSNYTTNGLVREVTMYIDKEQVERDFLDDLEFGTKVVTYDGKEHRFILESIELPYGISVEYLDEDGNLFGSRTEANEEGYTIYPHFINALDNNSEITCDLKGTLIIMRAPVSGAVDISAEFDNGEQSVTYNTYEHTVSVTNLPALLSLDTVTVSLDGNIISSGECKSLDVAKLTDAGDYEITVSFKNPGSNYVPVDPMTFTLTVDPIPYTSIQDSFPKEVTYEYNPNKPRTYVYESYKLPVGMSAELTYIDLDGNECEGLPTNVTEVGEYVCHLRYVFKEQNYTNLPTDINQTREAVLKIIPRTFDTAKNISLPDLEGDFDITKEWGLNLTPTDTLPDWVSFSGVTLYNIQHAQVSEARKAGQYYYVYAFTYLVHHKIMYPMRGKGWLKSGHRKRNNPNYGSRRRCVWQP